MIVVWPLRGGGVSRAIPITFNRSLARNTLGLVLPARVFVCYWATGLSCAVGDLALHMHTRTDTGTLRKTITGDFPFFARCVLVNARSCTGTGFCGAVVSVVVVVVRCDFD